jgi:uncharacterized membrane protein YkvA (DUF1232 family)
MARRRSLGTLDLGVIDRLRLGWRLLRDPRIPAWPKWIVPAAAVIYTFSPIDALPDFIPLLGQLDDLSVIAVAVAVVTMLMRWSPQEVVDEHAVALGLRDELPSAPEGGGVGRGVRGAQEPIDAKYWVDDWR